MSYLRDKLIPVLALPDGEERTSALKAEQGPDEPQWSADLRHALAQTAENIGFDPLRAMGPLFLSAGGDDPQWQANTALIVAFGLAPRDMIEPAQRQVGEMLRAQIASDGLPLPPGVDHMLKIQAGLQQALDELPRDVVLEVSTQAMCALFGFGQAQLTELAANLKNTPVTRAVIGPSKQAPLSEMWEELLNNPEALFSHPEMLRLLADPEFGELLLCQEPGALSEAHKIAAGDPDKMAACVALVKGGYFPSIHDLAKYRSCFGHDTGRLYAFTEVAAYTGPNGLEALAAGQPAHANDTALLEAIASRIVKLTPDEKTIEEEGLVHDLDAIAELADSNTAPLAHVAEKSVRDFIAANPWTYSTLISLVIKGGEKSLKLATEKLVTIVAPNKEPLTDKASRQLFKKLVHRIMQYGTDHAQLYFELREQGVITNENEEGYENYLQRFGKTTPNPELLKIFLDPEGNKEKLVLIDKIHRKLLQAKPLTADERAFSEVKAVIMAVYPDGDYGKYDLIVNNCQDRPADLEAYKIDNKGYTSKFGGISGYEVAAGKTENLELLANYVDRLKGIEAFVEGRKPEHAALVADFEAIVEHTFKAKMGAVIVPEGLTVDEKLAWMIAAECIENQNSKTYTPDSQLRDLVVAYKYVYQTDIEEDTQRRALDITQEQDGVCQRQAFWQECSHKYGENLAQTCDELLKSTEGSEPLKAWYKNSIRPAETTLSQKDEGRFKTILDNDRINPKKPALCGLAKKIFGANINFATQVEKNAFNAKIDKVFGSMDMNPRWPEVSAKVPALFKIRNERKHTLKEDARKIIRIDQHAINSELAKYKPIKKGREVQLTSYIAKTAETAHAGRGAFVCISDQVSRLENPKYLELVTFDDKACQGLTMLIDIETPVPEHVMTEYEEACADARDALADEESLSSHQWFDDGIDPTELKGEARAVFDTFRNQVKSVQPDKAKMPEEPRKPRYLWFGPNPYESLLDKISSEDCYAHLLQAVISFAQDNDFDGILVPDPKRIRGDCTNRERGFPELIEKSMLKTESGRLHTVDFGRAVELCDGYEYEMGVLIWEKPNSERAAP